MGRTATVTYEHVAAAADALKAAGGKPTARTLRERLGNVGSMGTITQHLQTWKSSQDVDTGPLTLPAAVQRTLIEFMYQELASAKAALRQELATQQQEIADLAADNDRLTAELTARDHTVTSLQAERSTLKGRLGQLQTDLAAVKEAASQARNAAESAHIELAKALQRVEALAPLEPELTAVRSELHAERQARSAAEKQAAVLTARLEAAIARSLKAEAEAAEARTQARDTRKALTQETAKATTAQNTIAKLNGKLDALQAQLQQQAHDLAAARQEVKKAHEQTTELRIKHGQAGSQPPRKSQR